MSSDIINKSKEKIADAVVCASTADLLPSEIMAMSFANIAEQVAMMTSSDNFTATKVKSFFIDK